MIRAKVECCSCSLLLQQSVTACSVVTVFYRDRFLRGAIQGAKKMPSDLQLYYPLLQTVSFFVAIQGTPPL